ncbi:MAG: trehalose-6-phosphate synthase [Chloroflexi bacterium]|nr:trehalose-6-phosphate synthase [Chloroflexota bacterium]
MTDVGCARVLVVTDRAPIGLELGPSGLRTARGSGGVVTTVRHAAHVRPFTWVASAVGDDLLAARLQRHPGRLLGSGDLAVRLVPLSAELFEDHRRAFADRVLWFAQHGLWHRRIAPETPERIRWLLRRSELAACRFADVAAAELHRPGQSPVVFVHDYQLYLVPQLLRARMPGARVAHFCHIPWPALSTWREAVPADVLVRIVRGLLGADALHFQTRASVEAFLSSVDELLPDATIRGDRIVHPHGSALVRARAASIDPDALRPDPHEVHRLRSDPRILVVRVDRADPIKNVPAGFAAFEHLLERHREYIGRVRFRARVIPTRPTVPEYQREMELVRTIARRINARFGAGAVELIERPDRGRALAELAAADVVLVNSLADGMNLVAKEAVVVGERSALVLSRRAGAYEELHAGAIGIEPTDIAATSDALRQAIEMPLRERAARAALMRAQVLSWTSREWLRSQFADFDEACGREIVAAIAS